MTGDFKNENKVHLRDIDSKNSHDANVLLLAIIQSSRSLKLTPYSQYCWHA